MRNYVKVNLIDYSVPLRVDTGFQYSVLGTPRVDTVDVLSTPT
jgi:S-ribosylhomocysteine lyase LuxS involved in autoinducer biosynthesis